MRSVRTARRGGRPAAGGGAAGDPFASVGGTPHAFMEESTFRCSKQTARNSYNMNEASTRAAFCALAAGVVLAFLTEDAVTADARRDAARGRELLAHYQCGACHEIPGVRNARGRLGPTLSGLAARAYIAGEVPISAATLQAWLIEPRALVPGTLMPAMGVSSEDAVAMTAYLLTLR